MGSALHTLLTKKLYIGHCSLIFSAGGEAKKTQTKQNKLGTKHKVELGVVSLNAWTGATSLLPGLQSFIEAPYNTCTEGYSVVLRN